MGKEEGPRVYRVGVRDLGVTYVLIFTFQGSKTLQILQKHESCILHRVLPLDN